MIVEDNSTDKTKYMYDADADTLTLPDAQGRVLQGTTDSINEIGAGLPNITGKVTGLGGTYAPEIGGEGALNLSNRRDVTGWGDGGETKVDLDFDASRSNEIYGASATVQPPALALIPQIKY